MYDANNIDDLNLFHTKEVSHDITSNIQEIARLSNIAIMIAGLGIFVFALALNIFSQNASAQSLPIQVGKTITLQK